jgi:hypothetical protein
MNGSRASSVEVVSDSAPIMDEASSSERCTRTNEALSVTRLDKVVARLTAIETSNRSLMTDVITGSTNSTASSKSGRS